MPAFDWTDGWDSMPEDDPHYAGRDVYRLPNVGSGSLRIFPGDQFWDTEERYLIEVAEVQTKVYRGVVGPAGEEGADCVFYDPDWSPPRDPRYPRRYDDDIHWMTVEEFAERIDDGTFVPHRGNGLERPPY